MTDTFIFDVVRTPRGKGHNKGALYEVKPIDLLATHLRALNQRHHFPTSEINDLLIGCVNPIDDQGSNIAKAALLYAGWDQQVSGVQINRQEAAGLEAINLAAMKIATGMDQLVVAGGIECMTLARSIITPNFSIPSITSRRGSPPICGPPWKISIGLPSTILLSEAIKGLSKHKKTAISIKPSFLFLIGTD
mgnify:CR=1 FL=1